MGAFEAVSGSIGDEVGSVVLTEDSEAQAMQRSHASVWLHNRIVLRAWSAHSHDAWQPRCTSCFRTQTRGDCIRPSRLVCAVPRGEAEIKIKWLPAIRPGKRCGWDLLPPISHVPSVRAFNYGPPLVPGHVCRARGLANVLMRCRPLLLALGFCELGYCEAAIPTCKSRKTNSTN